LGASARAECLAARRERLAALTSVLRAADSSTVERAVDAARSLPPVSRCARPIRGTPHDGNIAAQILVIERDLGRVDVLDHAGQAGAARGIAEPALSKARETRDGQITAKALLALGRIRAELDDPSAEAMLLDAVTTAEAAGDDELVARGFISLATEIGYHRGQLDRGIEWTRHAEAALTRLGGDDVLEPVRLHALGSLLWKKGRLDEATASLERAQQLLEARHGRDSAAVASVLVARARVVSDRGEPAEALRLDEQALAAYERELGSDHPYCASVLSNLSFEAMVLGKSEQAEHAAARAAAILEAKLGPTNRKLALPLDNLGAARMARHDDVGALAVFDRALAIVVRNKNDADPMLGTLANDRALALMHLHRLDEALALAREAVERRTRLLGPGHVDVGISQATVAEVLLARDDASAAVSAAAQAFSIVERGAGPETFAYADVLTTLGTAELRAGVGRAAAQHLESALRLREAHAWDPEGLERTRQMLRLAQATATARR
jgi:tetratricopeptide (TPR) repeat protein